MRIVFMGTPEFAVATLAAIHTAGHTLCAVVTAPDKPAGRGRQSLPSPVKVWAVQHHIPVLQPEKLKHPDFLADLQALDAEVFVVVAFRMLPEVVWSMPPKGTLNLHASLLPDYRGAAPINRAIMQGETRTGITTFMIQHEIDTGNILLQESIDIPADWNAGDLHDALMQKGAQLVCKTLEGLADKSLVPVPQPHTPNAPTAPKIFREDMRIRFTDTALQMHNQVRGLSPYPAAWCEAEGKLLKIYRTGLCAHIKTPAEPGTLMRQGNALLVRAADGWLEILELQPEGKKRMSADAYLRGYTLPKALN